MYDIALTVGSQKAQNLKQKQKTYLKKLEQNTGFKVLKFST
jgi:hypothetical protein